MRNRWIAPCLLAGCLWAAPQADLRAEPVYEALGERAGLVRIVDRLFVHALADARIKDKLADINIGRLKHRIVEHLCQVSGGPCRFRGISMKGSHAYLELTDAHFNALVEDLQIAMDESGVPFGTQNRFLALLAPMHRDIVTK